MSKTVDARGLSCPEPVIVTRRVLSDLNAGKVQVLVDNHAAKENVTRAAENMGWSVIIKEQGEDIILNISVTEGQV